MGSTDAIQSLLERALAGSALRQSVLANNLANANTPGFRRSDVDFGSTLARALDSSASPTQIGALSFTPQADTTSPVQADGNNVNVDTEMASMTENALTYQTIAEVAKARLHMIEIAIGVR